VGLAGMALVGGAAIAKVEVSVDGGEFAEADLATEDDVVTSLGHDALLLQTAEQYGGDWPYPDVWVPWSTTLSGLSAGRHSVIVRAFDSDGRYNIMDPVDTYDIARQLSLNLTIT